MVRRLLLALILVVSAFQLLAVMRVSTVVAAPPAVPFALTETAEPPTPEPPTNTPVVPPPATDTPVPVATTPAVAPTFTPLATTEPRDTATPVPPTSQPSATPSQPELTQTLIAATEIAGGSPTVTPTATPIGANTEPTPGKLPRTGEGDYSSPLLWLGIAVLAVAIGTRLRRRNA